MKTLVNKVFSLSGLENIELEIGTLFYFEDGIKKTFWLIVEVENLNDIIENQSEYFDQAKNAINNEWFDKNVSLLVLNKIESFDGIHSQVLKIEEDPFLFKKQVLLYTQSEYENLNNLLGSENKSIKDLLEKKILDKSVFKKHKENVNNNDYESLFYRLAHKIPFLKLNVKQQDGLTTLMENCAEEIDKTNYKSLNGTLEQSFFNLGIESIIELEPNAIYNSLLTTMNSDENK